MNTLLPIARKFAESAKHITPLGNGLINDTFLVVTENSSFVLQRINRQVFPVPEQIISNLITLYQHLAKQNKVSVKLQLPEILNTTANQAYFQDESKDFWRALSFIKNTESLETISTLADAQQAGLALGHFHRLFSDLDPSSLHDTLPGFHIAPGYLSRYHEVIKQISKKPKHFCAEFIDAFEHIANDLEHAKQQGLLPLRVIHGDPKLNNFLFDKHSKKVVSIIDLDTVKPGLVHYDIGDCLRSCCHSLDSDQFDLDICAAILGSYLSEAGAFFSEHDIRYLYPAIRLIPFELGIRFYTDYLEGNRYFKVTEPEQNLQRAAAQFHLCESITAQETDINRLIKALTS
ncbi:MAG: phosphotransferase enzyme family protein [Methylococcaceae bacterium]